jgi:sulfur carrier protein ThiS
MIRVVVSAKGVPGFSKTPVEMELPPGSTVATVLDLVLGAKGDAAKGVAAKGVAAKAVDAEGGPQQGTDAGVFHNVIATLNGSYVPASAVGERALATDDEITVMPLVVGG